VLIRVRNETRAAELGRDVRVASGLWPRLVGLLATPELPAGKGLWLNPCRSIHTFFMRYAIDAAFVNRENRIVHQATFRPWRMSAYIPSARGVLELPAGTLARTGTVVGDQLSFGGEP